MSIETYSVFNYGHTITDDNKFINFNEGGGELSAQISVGSYTLGEFTDAIALAMNDVGALEYTVTLDRSTRFITVTSTAAFDLLIASGTNSAISAYGLMGFFGADLTGLLTYEGGAASGSQFEPQNILQSFIPFENNVRNTNSSVNQSASGVVEVVTYGQVRFMECNIVPQTDVPNQGYIKNDVAGLANLRDFLSYSITKAPIEFVPDIDTPSTFTKCLLESTRQSRDGVDFKITQFKKLFKYFQSGQLTFRELE